MVGTLRPEVAADLGLPPGVQVSPGGGDNAMAALGVGAVEEGTWVLSLGTSGGLRAGALVSFMLRTWLPPALRLPAWVPD